MSFSSSGLLSIGLWLRWYWHACRRLLLKKPLAASNERKKHDRANVNSTHPTQKRERWISNTFHFNMYGSDLEKSVKMMDILGPFNTGGSKKGSNQAILNHRPHYRDHYHRPHHCDGHQHWFSIICRHVLTSWLAADYLQSRSLSLPPSLCHRNWNHDYD